MRKYINLKISEEGIRGELTMDYLKNFGKAVIVAGGMALAACSGPSENKYFGGLTDQYSFQITNTPLYRNGQRTNERMNSITFRPRDSRAQFGSIGFDDFNGNKVFDGEDWVYARDMPTGQGCGFGKNPRGTFVKCDDWTIDTVVKEIKKMSVAPVKPM
jgi:hypothetical protein